MDLDPGSPVWSSAKGMGTVNVITYEINACTRKSRKFHLLRVRREGVENGGVKEMEEEREGGRRGWTGGRGRRDDRGEGFQ